MNESELPKRIPRNIELILNDIQALCPNLSQEDAIFASLGLTHWMIKKAREGLIIAAMNTEDRKYTELDSPLLIAANAHIGPLPSD